MTEPGQLWPTPIPTPCSEELHKRGYSWPDELIIEQEIRERYAPLFSHVSVNRKNRALRNGFVVRFWFNYLEAPIKLHLFSRKKKSVLNSLDNQVSQFCHYHEILQERGQG